MPQIIKLKNYSFLVYGLGSTGKSVIRYFKKNKITNYFVWDDNTKLRKNFSNKKPSNLKENIKKEVIFLRKNQHTKPILTNDGFVVLMVCDRYLPEINFQNEDSLRNDIENKLFIQLSDRYINRLKRSSYIEKIN